MQTVSALRYLNVNIKPPVIHYDLKPGKLIFLIKRLFLSTYLTDDYNFSKNNLKYVKNKIYRPDEPGQNSLFGAHANYYSLKGAKAMFKIRTSEISYFDKEYMLMFKHFKNSSFICYPNLVVSNISSSTLNHGREILTTLEEEYYKKCFINFNFNMYNFIYLNLLDKSLFKIDEKNNDYEAYISNCLYHYFFDLNKINIVKKRLVMNFFNLQDIKMILNLIQNNQTNINPMVRISEQIKNPQQQIETTNV
jgi:hypothetical protein